MAGWYEISTPNFQRILDYQELKPDVQRWVYILIGRMLYDIGDLDGWQIILFFKGMAGSGKSTILLSVIKKFYDSNDVGILSNNLEKKFGLSAFADKYIFLAPEIKEDLPLEQTEFQSLVSGEDLVVNTKYKTTVAIKWHVTGALAGNELMKYKDLNGSIARRVALIEFINKVVNGDTGLGDKLEKEIHALLKKCNSSYLEASNAHGTKDIWSVLPPYFLETQEDMAEGTHSLRSFLKSGKVEFGKDLYCKYTTFMGAYNGHCAENTLDRKTFNKDFFQSPLKELGLTVKLTDTKMWPQSGGGENIKSKWVLGAGILEDTVHNDCGI